MKFKILTLFLQIFHGPINHSLIGKAFQVISITIFALF